MKLKPLSFLFILIFFTSSLSAQWEWVNPYPQGTNLWNIHFVEGSETGYALGSSGTIIKTIDGGSNWEAISSPAQPRIHGAWAYSAIQFLDEDTGFFGGKTFVKTADGGITWETIGNDIDISAFAFLDEDFGFVGESFWQIDVYPSRLYKVLNGGHDWEELPATGFSRITSVNIFADSTIVICGTKGKVVFPNYKYFYAIARSEDFGQSWQDSIFEPFEGRIRDMEFRDSLNGFACGSGGFLIQTNDGGRTWDRINLNPEIHPISMELFGDSIVTLNYDGSSSISTDNGNNWTTTTLTANFKVEHFGINGSGDCVAVGEAGLIEILKNGNESWVSISRNAADRDNQALFSIQFPTNEIGYTGGYFGNVFKTIDGGRNWTKLNRYNSSHVWDLYCIDENLVYAVNGNIIRSVNGGESWEEAFNAPNLPLMNISFLPSGHGFASGNMNKIYKTNNNGWSWRNISPEHRNCNIYDHFFFDSLNGIVVGANHYYAETHNGGLSWVKRSVAPQAEGNLNSICFPSKETGYMVGTENFFYKTTNGGKNWSISDIGHGPHGYVFFINENTGYIVDHIVRETNDGGATWDTLNLNANIAFGDMCMSPDSTIYYCGGEGMIMRNEEFKTNSTGIRRNMYASGLQVDVWPNPASDKLNISLSGISGETLVIKLTSITGAETFLYYAEPAYGELNQQIDVSRFQPGIYFLTVLDGKNHITRKILLL